MKNIVKKLLGAIFATAVVAFASPAVMAQNSLPAPGAGGGYTPNIGNAGWNNGIGWNPGPPPPSAWGSPWYSGWNYSPTIVVSPSVNNGLTDQGITKVVACGYDAQGVWRVIPITVSYQYNGAQYVVNVLNAWNPWTDSWDRGVDVPAYDTDYYINNVEYSYYCVLPTGTFYFNL